MLTCGYRHFEQLFYPKSSENKMVIRSQIFLEFRMTKFVSTVRFTVKDDCVDEFIKREKELDFTGMAEQITLIKTGDTTFCWIGVFESEDAIANCRPKMIQQLDTIRHTLKEISPELGVTDPASGPVIFDWKAN